MNAMNSPPASSSAQLYAALEQSAHVGVQRLPPPTAVLTSAPSSASHQAMLAAYHLPSSHPAQALLRACAVATTLMRCARQPALVSTPVLPPAPPERRPAVQAPALIHLLQRLLHKGPAELRPMVYQRLGQAGLRLPEALLPQALEQSRHHSALRPLLAPLLGARGRWLAGLNPAWRYASGVAEDANKEQIWLEGSLEQRQALLQTERSQHPDPARERLAASLKELPAKERLALVQTLESGLSAADEALLEQFLADRSKEVRLAAARLLSCLPHSAQAQRLTGWLQAMLQAPPPPSMAQKIQAALGKKTAWQIEPPEAADPAWETAGLALQPPSHVRAPRNWWLQQLVAHTPLQFWPDQLGMEIEQLWQWSADSDWKNALRHGWFAALQVQRDSRWLPLLTHLMRQPQSLQDSQLENQLPPLWSSIFTAQPLAQQQAFWQQAITHAPQELAQVVEQLDTLLPPTTLWSPALSAQVLTHLPRLLRAHDSYQHNAIPTLHRCARRLSDCQLPALAQLWSGPNVHNAPFNDNAPAVALLDFVVQLRQALPPALSALPESSQLPEENTSHA